MKVSRRHTTLTKVELKAWEVQDLMSILKRIRDKPSVSKSEFSMREKTLGRKLLQELESS